MQLQLHRQDLIRDISRWVSDHAISDPVGALVAHDAVRAMLTAPSMPDVAAAEQPWSDQERNLLSPGKAGAT